MRLLLLNANTTVAVTELCAAAARDAAAPGTEIVPVTPRFGPRIIQSRAENAIAAHGLLDALAHALAPDGGAGPPDAVLLAVSFDTALDAARELAPCPVIGMTQAGLVAAGLLAERVGLVCFSSAAMYRELAAGYGLGRRLAGVAEIDAHPTDAFADPGRLADRTEAAATRLATEHGAGAVLLAGAGFAGLAARLAKRAPVPLLDGITSGVQLAEMLARAGRRRQPAHRGSGAVGLSAALEGIMYRERT